MRIARLLGCCIRLEWLLRRGVPCSDRMQHRLQVLQLRLGRLRRLPPGCTRPHALLLRLLRRYRRACDEGGSDRDVERLRQLALSQVQALGAAAARDASGPPAWLWRLVAA